MASVSPILQAGTLVGNRLAATGIFMDDGSAPVLNVQHLFQGGAINLSAGVNPAAGFYVTPVAQGNTQILTGPNATFANVLSAPGTFAVGTANVANALNVTGPTILTGPLTATGNIGLVGNTTISGSANVVSNLTVGSTIFAPTLFGNAITASGSAANLYIETKSSASSNTSALYLSSGWRVKVISSGGLSFQSLLNGNWVNSYVISPSGLSISIANLTTPIT